MPESFSRKGRKFQQYFWRSIISLTVFACAIFLYISYLYRGEITYSPPDHVGTFTADKIAQSNCEDVCLSTECVQMANSLIENIDLSVDPCEDFYSYSCGGWVKRHLKGGNHSVIDEMKMLTRLTIRDVMNQIQAPPETPIGKLKTVYDSCMNYGISEVNAVPSILKYFESLGIRRWPNLPHDFRFSNPSLAEVLAILISYHEFGFVGVANPESNKSNHLKNFTIYSTSFYLPDEERYQQYKPEVLKILDYFNVTGSNAVKMWNDFKDIDLQYVHLKQEFHIDDRYQDDEKEFSLLNCSTEANDNLTFICDILKHVVNYNKIGDHYSKDYALTKELDFLQVLKPFTSNFSDSTLANYLALRVFLDHLSDLNHFFREMTLIPGGVFERPSKLNNDMLHMRWIQCIEWLIQALPFPLIKAYVPKVLSNKIMEDVNQISNTVMKEAARLLKQQEWMGETARQNLSKNLNDMKNTNENDTTNISDDQLRFILSEFHPVNDSFFLNVMEHKKYSVMSYLLNKYEQMDVDFPFDLFDTNAYHHAGALRLAYGILLPPVYRRGLPRYFNFISLGQAVGHEVGHEIEGYFVAEEESIDNQTRDNFLTKRNCLEEQYNEFDLHQIMKKVKGNSTFSENFADLIGLQISEKLMSKILSRGTERELRLPALPLSAKQLLYVITAQWGCLVRTKEKEEHEYENDRHAAPYVRVNGMLQNSEKFALAFNCSRGSFMNPVKRCNFYE